MNATQAKPCQARTSVTSTTQSRCGAAARKWRCTKSVGRARAGNDLVVNTLFERFTPTGLIPPGSPP